jgi:hypothetical protein
MPCTALWSPICDHDVTTTLRLLTPVLRLRRADDG